MKLTNQVMNRKFSKKLPIERKISQGKFNNIKYKLKKTHKLKSKLPGYEIKPYNTHEMEGGFIFSIINWFRNKDKRDMLKKILNIFKKIAAAIKLLRAPQRKLVIYNKKLKFNIEQHTADVNMMMYRYQELIIYNKREFYYQALANKTSNSEEDPDYIASQIKVDKIEILKITNSMKMHLSKKNAREPEIRKLKTSTDREKIKLEGREFKKIEKALEAYAKSGKELEEIRIQLKNYAIEAGIRSKEKEDGEVKRDRLKAESFYRFFKNFNVDEKKIAEAYDLYSSVGENIRDIDVSVANYNSLNKQYDTQSSTYDKIKTPLQKIFGDLMPKIMDKENVAKLEPVVKEFDEIILEYKRLGPATNNTLIPKLIINKDTILIANQILVNIHSEIKLVLDYLFTLNPLGSELSKRMELIITNNAFILSFLHTVLEGSENLKSFFDRGSVLGGGKYITQHGGALEAITISSENFAGNLALFNALLVKDNTITAIQGEKFTSALDIADDAITAITDLVVDLFDGAAGAGAPGAPGAPGHSSGQYNNIEIKSNVDGTFTLEFKDATGVIVVIKEKQVFTITIAGDVKYYYLNEITGTNPSDVVITEYPQQETYPPILIDPAPADGDPDSFIIPTASYKKNDIMNTLTPVNGTSNTVTRIDTHEECKFQNFYYTFHDNKHFLINFAFDASANTATENMFEMSMTTLLYLFHKVKQEIRTFIFNGLPTSSLEKDTDFQLTPSHTRTEVTSDLNNFIVGLCNVYQYIPTKYTVDYVSATKSLQLVNKLTSTELKLYAHNIIKIQNLNDEETELKITDIDVKEVSYQTLIDYGTSHAVSLMDYYELEYANNIQYIPNYTFAIDTNDLKITPYHNNLGSELTLQPNTGVFTYKSDEEDTQLNILYFISKNDADQKITFYTIEGESETKNGTTTFKFGEMKSETKEISDINATNQYYSLQPILSSPISSSFKEKILYLNDNLYGINKAFNLLEITKGTCFTIGISEFKFIKKDGPAYVIVRYKKGEYDWDPYSNFKEFTDNNPILETYEVTKITDDPKIYEITIDKNGLKYKLNGSEKIITISSAFKITTTDDMRGHTTEVEYILNSVNEPDQTITVTPDSGTPITIYSGQLELVKKITSVSGAPGTGLTAVTPVVATLLTISPFDTLKTSLDAVKAISLTTSSPLPEYYGLIVFNQDSDIANWNAKTDQEKSDILSDVAKFRALAIKLQCYILNNLSDADFDNLPHPIKVFISQTDDIKKCLSLNKQAIINKLSASLGATGATGATGAPLMPGYSGNVYGHGVMNSSYMSLLDPASQKPGKASNELLELMIANKEKFENIFSAIRKAFDKIKLQDSLFKDLNKEFINMTNIQTMIKNMAPNITFPKGEKASLFYAKDKESNKLITGESPLEQIAKTKEYSNMVKAMEIQISSFIPEIMSMYAEEAKRNPGLAMVSLYSNMSSLIAPDTVNNIMSSSKRGSVGFVGVPGLGMGFGIGLGSGSTIGQVARMAGFPALKTAGYPQPSQRAQLAMQRMAPEIARVHASKDYPDFVNIMKSADAKDVLQEPGFMTALALTDLGMAWIKDEKEGLPWLAGTKEGNDTRTFIMAELRLQPSNAVTVYMNDLTKKYDEFIKNKHQDAGLQAASVAETKSKIASLAQAQKSS